MIGYMEEKKLGEGRPTDKTVESSVLRSKQASQIFYWQLSQVAKMQGFLLVRWTTSEVWNHPLSNCGVHKRQSQSGVKDKLLFHRETGFGADILFF